MIFNEQLSSEVVQENTQWVEGLILSRIAQLRQQIADTVENDIRVGGRCHESFQTQFFGNLRQLYAYLHFGYPELTALLQRNEATLANVLESYKRHLLDGKLHHYLDHYRDELILIEALADQNKQNKMPLKRVSDEEIDGNALTKGEGAFYPQFTVIMERLQQRLDMIQSAPVYVPNYVDTEYDLIPGRDTTLLSKQWIRQHAHQLNEISELANNSPVLCENLNEVIRINNQANGQKVALPSCNERMLPALPATSEEDVTCTDGYCGSNNAWPLPGASASDIYRVNIMEMVIATSQLSLFQEEQFVPSNNSAVVYHTPYYNPMPEPIQFQYEPQIKIDAQTGQPLFTVTAYQYGLAIGGFQLFGTPEFCCSRTGKNHNMINLTGELSSQAHRIDTTQTDIICDVLPPREKSWEAEFNDAAIHGVIYGASDVVKEGLTRAGTSGWMSSAIAQVVYFGTMFTIRYYKHNSELLETEEPDVAFYHAMAAAGTETATLAAIQAAYNVTDVLSQRLKQRGGLWEYPGYVLDASKEAVNLSRYSTSSPISMATGFVSQTATQLIGSSLLNTFFGRRQPAQAQVVLNNEAEEALRPR